MSSDSVIKPRGLDLPTRLLAHLDKVEQQAIAAGHGFGHLPLLTEHNAGWTRLDLDDNVRPGYDQRFVKDNNPDHVVRLVRAHRDIAETYQQQAATLATMRRATRYAKVPERLPTSDELRAAAAVVDAVYAVLVKLARGYGLQEDQT